MLATLNQKADDVGLKLYVEYARLRDSAVGAFRSLVTDQHGYTVSRDQRGQAGETSMLMRISLVVAILLAIGGLIFAALRALGVDVAAKIRNPAW